MNKFSSEELQKVLTAVPGALRSLATERDYWRKEAQSRMRRDDAEKVARAMHDKGINSDISMDSLIDQLELMHDKGINSDISMDSLIDQLEKAASAGNLEKIADAVEMVGPDMGQKIAHLSDDSSSKTSSGSSHELERFILGGVG